MATPTNLPAAFTVGQVATAAQMNDLRGAFRILQVISNFADAQNSSASTTYIDSGLTATITPQSTSNKILVVYSQNIYSNASATGGGLRLVRNLPSANTVLQTDIDLSYGTASGILVQQTFIYVDSPATTSAITYKTQFNRTLGSGSIFVQANGSSQKGNILLLEVSA
jgi:hypothetical protein